jgi:hypothetical protein
MYGGSVGLTPVRTFLSAHRAPMRTDSFRSDSGIPPRCAELPGIRRSQGCLESKSALRIHEADSLDVTPPAGSPGSEARGGCRLLNTPDSGGLIAR